MRQILAGNRAVNYIVRRSRRARRVRISVACDSSVVVTLPQGFGFDSAEQFIRAKFFWVLRALEYFKPYKNQRLIKSGRRDYLANKQLAWDLVKAKIYQLNKIYGFTYNKINIKNQKTRWGSCSKQGNLNFNYQVVRLPPSLLEYLVAHELCHLGQMNHSARFWELVARAIPDYKQKRRQLRQVGVFAS